MSKMGLGNIGSGEPFAPKLLRQSVLIGPRRAAVVAETAAERAKPITNSVLGGAGFVLALSTFVHHLIGALFLVSQYSNGGAQLFANLIVG